MAKPVYTKDDILRGVQLTSQLHQQAMAYPSPQRPEMLEGHCMTCQDKKAFVVEGSEVMKNGAIRKHGKSDCGHVISHFVSGATGG